MVARRSRLAPWLCLPLALTLGCGTAPTPTVVPTPAATTSPALPSAQPSTDALAVYATIADQVEQIRDLRPKAPVTPVLIDEATLRANLTADFDHDNPPAAIAASQAILTTLGFLKPGTSLRDAYLDLEAGQVIGYYSPGKDRLFVVSRSGGVGPTQKVTYSHEFTHQLQDQNFDLSRLGLDTPDQGDRALARLALVEGDAVTTQTTWMTRELTPQELGQVIVDASDPVATAALQRAPAILRTTSLFPYTQGYAFVGALMAGGAGTKAVDAAFGDPPDSTEQVLHPQKYLDREPPISVTLPNGLATALGSGWAATAQDTLGELILRTWLDESGLSLADATAAAAGWGGDRIELLSGPGEHVAIALVTRWDDAANAAEFAAAARRATTALAGASEVGTTPGSTRVTLTIAPTAALAAALSRALGE